MGTQAALKQRDSPDSAPAGGTGVHPAIPHHHRHVSPILVADSPGQLGLSRRRAKAPDVRHWVRRGAGVQLVVTLDGDETSPDELRSLREWLLGEDELVGARNCAHNR